MWRILAYRKIILEAKRYRERFLFDSSNDNKKAAGRGEDCAQMKRDVENLDRCL